MYGRRGVTQDNSTTGPAPASTGSSETETDSTMVLDPDRLIVGVEAGAAFLEISQAAFLKRRQRTSGPFASEIRLGNRPAWPASALAVSLDRNEVTTNG